MAHCVLLLILLLAPTAAAQAPGGGSKTSDCWTEFGAVTPVNRPSSKPSKIRCIDNDPSCDSDPRVGVCGFRVQVCANVDDARLPRCSPTDLLDYAVENYQPDENPRHDFDSQALEDAVNASVVPLGPSETDVCSAEVSMTLSLPVRIKRGSASFKRAKKLLRTWVEGPGAVRDSDKLPMLCLPDRDASPCDDVTSTFDQIQRHVITPGCGRDTCHNTSQPAHQLSLAPGESHAALVGVAPFNVPASNAGKLRVDPGNPDNSFLLDKLQGKLDSFEGERMPFGLRPLKKTHIRLIEDWIAAGAPETGFVSEIGCQN